MSLSEVLYILYAADITNNINNIHLVSQALYSALVHWDFLYP